MPASVYGGSPPPPVETEVSGEPDPGPAGPQGPQGVQGVVGSQGVQGSQGATGAVGAQGAQGAQGTTGSQGATGSQGPQGAVGVQGSTGAQGSAGPQGTTGAQGDTGSQGAQGLQGGVGAQGTTGAQGSQGDVGATGSQGAVGAQGLTGSQGDAGATGTQGAQGAVGAQGTQGAQGAQGAQGLGLRDPQIIHADLAGSDFTSTTTNSNITVLSTTFTPTVAGFLTLASRMQAKHTAQVDLTAWMEVAPAPAAGDQYATDVKKAAPANTDQWFQFVGVAQLAANTQYTLTLKVFKSVAGTVTVEGDALATSLSALFTPKAS